MFLSPRGPDGKTGGTVEKIIRKGAQPMQEYAEPVTGNDLRIAPDHAPGSTPPGPTAPDELAALKVEAKKLKAAIDDPNTGAVDRTRMAMRLSSVRSRIDQLETALLPAPQAGERATAGQAQQYMPPVPYSMRGAELNAVRRSQLKAEAAGLEGQLAGGTLTPAETIRTEQALKMLRQILDEARPDDWQIGQQ